MPDFRSLVAAVAVAGGLDWPERSGRPLDEVCVAFVADLPVDGVSMSVFAGSTVRETVGSSDVVAELIEDVQYALGVGPCYDAFARRGPVLVADIRDGDESRWPAFARSMERTPVRALYAFPLHLGGVVVGAVDVYRVTPGLPEAQEFSDLLRAVDLLVVALASARGPELSEVIAGVGAGPDAGQSDRGDRTGAQAAPSAGSSPIPSGQATAWDGFLDALPSDRAQVHQAIGMVIGRLGGTPEQALARVRAYAFARDRTITEVAADIVARRLELPA